ncbi:MAG TPA: hypothetical protein VGO98_03125, partial [Candidatus Saccharimonadales bacterium]|nr:hypothetical protein [Candidatus Saccharimonadales bacterium]
KEYFLGSALPKETCSSKSKAQEESEKKQKEQEEKKQQEEAAQAAEEAAQAAEKAAAEEQIPTDPATDEGTGAGSPSSPATSDNRTMTPRGGRLLPSDEY